MTSERLTRQELGWLLAQEARGAAKALRSGVTQLRQPAPPIEPVPHMELSLDALDGAIELLAELESKPISKGRRGRIDLAALLYEIAPGARIIMEPGAGTEVLGDELELRRMLHVLVTQAAPGVGEGAVSPEIRVRREEDQVRVEVVLGPDRPATAELERRWLARMAMRMGGRLELEGAHQSLTLPADGASAQRQVDELKKELEQAQQLGEAYARELAEVFASQSLPVDRGPDSSPISGTASVRPPIDIPPLPTFGDPGTILTADLNGAAETQLAVLSQAALALARSLGPLMDGLADAQSALLEGRAERETVAHRLTVPIQRGEALLRATLRLGAVSAQDAPQTFDWLAEIRAMTESLRAEAGHRGLELLMDTGTLPSAPVHARREVCLLLTQSLLDRALAMAGPRSQIRVALVRQGLGYLISVAVHPIALDETTAAPSKELLRAGHSKEKLTLEEPNPQSLSELVAAVAAGCLGGAVQITDDLEGGRRWTFNLA